MTSQKLIYVPGSGNHIDPKFVFLGEAPGATEERTGVAFSGKSGQFLRKSIIDVGVSIDDCYFTNLVKVRPENNRPPTKREAASWRRFLFWELLNFGLDFGKKPTYIALGITARDSLINLNIENFYYLHHPSYVLRFNKKKEWLNNLKVFLDSSDKSFNE